MIKNKILLRLRRVKGQVGAVERMWAEKRDCLAVVQQLTAATAALKKITELVLTDEVCSCRVDKDKKWGEKLRRLLKLQ